MINIVGMVFVAVGIILAIQRRPVSARLKNEDADSKSRASTLLVVSVILIAFPSIVSALDLVDKLPQV